MTIFLHAPVGVKDKDEIRPERRDFFAQMHLREKRGVIGQQRRVGRHRILRPPFVERGIKRVRHTVPPPSHGRAKLAGHPFGAALAVGQRRDKKQQVQF